MLCSFVHVLSSAFLAGSLRLAGLPRLAQGLLQLLPVSQIASLQALQLLVFFLVQDAQEILGLWKAKSFPLRESNKTEAPGD